MKNLLCIFLLVLPSMAHADPSPRISAWKQIELNDKFMRSLTKQQCMTKTIASLTACSSSECTKALGGVVGDCVVYAAGDLETFCSTYDLEYLRSYCGTNELNSRSCRLLMIGKTTLCKTPEQPLK